MILEIVFYTVALVLGMKIAVQEDMILEKLGLYQPPRAEDDGSEFISRI
jgi:hypothetical protein